MLVCGSCLTPDVTLLVTQNMPWPNYWLFLRFNNGQSGEANLVDELNGEAFGPLRDPALSPQRAYTP